MPAKPIYALVGSDPFLQLESLREILLTLGSDVQRLSFDGDRVDLATLLDEVRSYSMFGPGKVVVVRQANDFLDKYREKLEEFVANETPTNAVVFRFDSLPANQRIYKAIDKVGQITKCEPPKAAAVPGWIAKRAKSEHGVEIEPAAAGQLADLVGVDLGRIDSELAKLAIQTTTGKITAAEVTSTVAFQREQEIWEITTLLGRGMTEQAIGRWRELVRSDPSMEFRAVTWLGIWLENCRTVLLALEKQTPMGVVGKQIRIWDDRVLKEFVGTAKKMGRAGVTRQLERLTDLDLRIKSGLANASDGVERFMATAVLAES
jgi:DNA polymerase-3 subunit delta